MKRILQQFKYSQQQTQQLILVDFNDQLKQPIDKWQAHSTNYIFKQQSYPHRAFSLFLFDQNYKLLLQQRSSAKQTFPMLWTNTCCSHQLFHENENDSIMKYRLSEYYVKKRTLEELNFDIKETQVELIQKIIYSAKDNDQYGEYECIINMVQQKVFKINKILDHFNFQNYYVNINYKSLNNQCVFLYILVDYIYFAKLQQDQPKINWNPEEVNDCKWLTLNEFLLFKQLNQKSFTPWFNLINETYLLNWWTKYKENNNSFISQETIVKLN